MSTNFISVVMALVLALTGLCGSVGSSGMTPPVTVEFGVGLDGDISYFAGNQSEENLAVIQKLVNALSIRVAAEESASQLEILLNGKSMASMAVKSGEDSWEAVSDLFPSVLLTVKKSTVDSFLNQASGSLPSLDTEVSLSSIQEIMDKVDTEVILKKLSEVGGELHEAFESRFGEAETGTFTVNDREYTSKTVCGITMKEAVDLIVPAVRKIVSDESFAPVLSLFGEDFSLEDLEETLQDIQDSDEEDMPALSIVKYSSDNGDTCLDVTMERDEQSISFSVAFSAEEVSIHSMIWMDGSNHLVSILAISKETGECTVNAELASAGQSMLLNGVMAFGEDKGSYEMNVTLPAFVSATPLTLRISGSVSHDAPVFTAADGLETFALEDLMQEGEAADRFNSKVMIGAMQLLAKVAADFPEITKLMNSSPAGSSPAPAEVEVIVEETPAEETPVEEAPVEAPSDEGSAA